MKLKLEDFVFRSWNYFRHGYSTYLSFFVSFVTFVSTTYYLAIRSVPFLQEIFPNFHVFVIVGILVFGLLGILIGWLHMKGTLAYPTAVTITTEANPYNYIVLPGKQREAFVPAWLLTMQALHKILEKEKLLSPQEKREFENIKDKLERMIKGEVIGRPRQRRLLVAVEREKERSKSNKYKMP